MILTIDVGNTSSACAIFRGQNIVCRSHIPTPKRWLDSHLKSLLPANWTKKIQAVIVSSVVPPLDKALAENIKKTLGLTVLFLDHRTKTGISLKIDKPSELGADRIADCLGSLRFFKPPLIVIDSGTATTFDLLTENYEYYGGSILPGMAIAIKSLAENTAKLKYVPFAVPDSPVGTNTINSIRAGIYFGYIGALAHLITLYREILGPRSKVIATGGLIRYFKGQVPGIDAFEPDLLFYGLKSVYDKQQRSK